MELVNLLKEHIALETLYYVFAILVFFDITTGMIKAWKKQNFKSRTLRNGMFASIAEILALLLCIFIANIIPISSAIVFTILIFMVLKEASSIVENLIEIGAKLPKWLIKGLQVNTDKIDNLNDSQRNA